MMIFYFAQAIGFLFAGVALGLITLVVVAFWLYVAEAILITIGKDRRRPIKILEELPERWVQDDYDKYIFAGLMRERPQTCDPYDEPLRVVLPEIAFVVYASTNCPYAMFLTP